MIDAMDVKVIQKVREYLSTQPVLKAWVFGSFSRGEQTPSSDVDIIVVFDEKAEVSLIGYIRIQYELENIFGRKVDLVEDGSLLPFAAESANRDRKLMYERASERQGSSGVDSQVHRQCFRVHCKIRFI